MGGGGGGGGARMHLTLGLKMEICKWHGSLIEPNLRQHIWLR